MGESYRATTITPVPRAYGVRGGNAIARSVAQAIQLCALHALDVLCALGLPLFLDPAKQTQFLRRRRVLRMITPEGMRRAAVRPKAAAYMLKPTWVPNTTSELAGSGWDGGGRATATRADSPPPQYYAMPLPGYLMEAGAVRLPPPSDDTLSILQLRTPEDCDVFGEGAPEEEVQALGNAAKVCVQNYLREQLELDRQQRTLGNDGDAHDAAGEGKEEGGDPTEVLSAHEREELEKLSKWAKGFPPNLNASFYVTGYARQVSVYNIAYLRIPAPPIRRVGCAAPAEAKPLVVAQPLRGKKGTPKPKATEGNPHAEDDAPAALSGVEPVAEAAPPGVQAVSPNPSPGEGGEPHGEAKHTEVDRKDDVEVWKVGSEGGYHLAVGLSLKKKDAERMCFLHAAALLHYYYREDVLMHYRSGLPRKGGATSYECIQKLHKPLIAKAVMGKESNEQESDQDDKGGSLNTTGSGTGVQTHSTPPKPFLHGAMKTFMESGRALTHPKRRPTLSSLSPF
ncbi:unnamed protein product [Phytomonas sp. EM1]|nr:unnamed protein product [Phytomonas sp. EM1]|eukprot:CCW64660.1 unnamed protein product [Phytomonas sp. isolate EM1]